MNVDHESSDTAKFPDRTKCDFCDITFKCDMDVSRHLKGRVHLDSVNSFMSLRNEQDKVVEKQIPKNFEQLLKTLKIRNPRDVEELVDKGYFEVTDEKQAGILQQMSRQLLLSIWANARDKLHPSMRAALKLCELETRPTPIRQAQASTIPSTNPASVLPERPAPIVKTESVLEPESIRAAPAPQPPVTSRAAPAPQTPVTSRAAPASQTPSTSRPSGSSRPARQGPESSTTRKSATKKAPTPQCPPPKPPSTQPKESTKTVQPDPNSTYVPKLAIIKIEPKD